MSKRIVRFISIGLTVAMLAGLTAGCGNSTASDDANESVSGDVVEDAVEAPEIPGLDYESREELAYATQFDIFYYSDGYQLIDVHGDRQYLLVPEGMEAPEGLDESIIVLYKPLDRIYLAATATMALFNAIDALDNITLAGTKASGWYIEAAADAMNEGKIQFAGKYSEPDYELLVDEDCDLALESTMILHTPKVQEMIENLGIPMFIDRSSYETNPLGRTEWIKVYGAMTDKMDEACSFFDEQAKVMDEMEDQEDTGLTVAFFYLNSDGTVVVRASEDYIPTMIKIAGGEYIFEDIKNEESTSKSVELTMEEFYAAAIDADYLVYNASIDSELDSIEALIQKDELFKDFKAVQDGNVYCTTKYLYQATDTVAQLILDFNQMLTTDDDSDMTFLYKLSE